MRARGAAGYSARTLASRGRASRGRVYRGRLRQRLTAAERPVAPSAATAGAPSCVPCLESSSAGELRIAPGRCGERFLSPRLGDPPLDLVAECGGIAFDGRELRVDVSCFQARDRG